MSNTFTRFQLELRKVDVTVLNDLMADAGIEKREDLFNNALALLDWAIRQKKNGKIIASVDERKKSYRELDAQFLNGI